jgi:hypothetical protein
MSAALQNSIIEDAVLDIALCQDNLFNNVESVIDATNVMDRVLRTIFVDASLLIAAGVSKRLAYKAYLSIHGGDITVDRLSKRLNKVSIESNDNTNKFFVLANIGNTRRVTVRLPDVDKKNDGQIDNIALVLDAIKTTLNLKTDEIKVIFDPTLGTDFHISSTIQRLLTAMIGSCHSKDGTFSGTVFEFKTKLKANLVEILATIKLLKDRSGKLRNLPGVRGKDGKIVLRPTLNIEDLKSKFNEESGLKAPGTPAYITGLVVGLLSELVKVTNKAFPGVWIHSLKNRNSAKSSDAIIAKCGMKPIVISPHKILKVFLTKAKKNDKGKFKLEPFDFDKKGVEDTPDYREFRAIVALTLPLINPTKEISKKILSIDPLSIDNKIVIDFYKSITKTVDALDLCFSIQTAVLSSTNKVATPEQFLNCKGNLVSSLNENEGFIDSNGVNYPLYRDIPEHCRKFLESAFNKKIVGAKRAISDLESAPTDTVMQVASSSKVPQDLLEVTKASSLKEPKKRSYKKKKT